MCINDQSNADLLHSIQAHFLFVTPLLCTYLFFNSSCVSSTSASFHHDSPAQWDGTDLRNNRWASSMARSRRCVCHCEVRNSTKRALQSRILMVGAGGIGCELLKNLVLTGFGEIHIVDLDTIDLSNLNRQFLFRHEHIKKSKAIVSRHMISSNRGLTIPYSGRKGNGREI